MGILKGLTKGILDVVTTPVSVAADIVTLGGILQDEETPYTVQKIKRIKDDYEELFEED